MNSLKMSILAVAISFCIPALAGNTTDERDKSLERRKSGETMMMRDCLEKNGNDKALCNEGTPPGTTNAPNSRLNRERNNQMIEDRKSRDLDRDLNIRDLNGDNRDMSPRDLPSGDSRTDNRTRDISPADTRPN